MDVKFGSGAFMAEREAADELARALVEVAGGAGLPTVALLTDMDEVLGTTAGNAVEVREAIDYLTGTREPRLHEVTIALAASLIEQGGLAEDGRAAAEQALDSGAAAERFAAMVAALGGPADFVERPDLPTAPVTRAAAPERPGIVTAMDCRAVGLVVTGLGGNRRREDDVIDPAVGLTEVAPVGAEVGPDRPLAVVHAATEAAADEAAAALRAAIAVGDEPPAERPCDRREDRVTTTPGEQRFVVPAADRTVPKAELHVHLEGTAPPALVRRLAERNGLDVPEGVFADEETFAWSDFLHFLRTYDLAASVIRTAEDYRDVTFEYLESVAAEGGVYVELIASPDHAAAVGLTDAEHYAGIAQGIDDARDAHGIEARIVVAAVRNLGVEAAEAIARRHADDRHPYVVGFNLVGDEAAWPADRFARAYEIAAGSGLGCTVHAGEHGGPGVDPRRPHAARHPDLARRPRRRGPGARRRARRARRSCSRSARPPTSRSTSSPPTRTIRSVRSGRPGCGSRSGPTIRPTSAVVSAPSMPSHASATASRRDS